MLAPPSDPDDEVSVASSLNSASSAALGISSSATPFARPAADDRSLNDSTTAVRRSVAPQKPSHHFPKTHANARCDLTRATRKTQTSSSQKTMADARTEKEERRKVFLGTLKRALREFEKAGGDKREAQDLMTTFAYKRFVKNDAGIGAPASVDAN